MTAGQNGIEMAGGNKKKYALLLVACLIVQFLMLAYAIIIGNIYEAFKTEILVVALVAFVVSIIQLGVMFFAKMSSGKIAIGMSLLSVIKVLVAMVVALIIFNDLSMSHCEYTVGVLLYISLAGVIIEHVAINSKNKVVKSRDDLFMYIIGMLAVFCVINWYILIIGSTSISSIISMSLILVGSLALAIAFVIAYYVMRKKDRYADKLLFALAVVSTVISVGFWAVCIVLDIWVNGTQNSSQFYRYIAEVFILISVIAMHVLIIIIAKGVMPTKNKAE